MERPSVADLGPLCTGKSIVDVFVSLPLSLSLSLSVVVLLSIRLVSRVLAYVVSC